MLVFLSCQPILSLQHHHLFCDTVKHCGHKSYHKMKTNEPIAVVGSGCRFPGGASSPSKLWKLLKEPRDVQSKVDRFAIDAFYNPDGSYHGKGNARHAYLLEEDPYAFDASFFNIHAHEANAIDPQHRLLLETVYEGISSAGLRLEDLQGSSTAVYVGMMQHDFADITNYDLDAIPTYGATGTSAAILSNRVSYFFDWHGPSMTIDTACSSSLVALHHAVQQLREGSSKVAVAAGANLILGPLPFVVESKLNMLSPTGRSRMWDADADGYARGEGVAAIVLKTLSQALADGDSIECIIRETGVNQDGRTPGITMPNHKAQKDLIRETYAKAGLDLSKPENRCQFFEAHGTGTPAGDPQEAEAISSAFFGDTPRGADEEPMYVGSVKTVIGHTEGTAGIAGLMKASLAMKHGILPPNLLFNQLAPRVAQFYDDLEIVTTARAWPSIPHGAPRRVSVNSFGFGGTNAHVIVESFEGIEQTAPIETSSPCLAPLTLSAGNEQSLKANMQSLLKYLQTEPDIQMKDLVWTYLKKRSDLGTRRAIVGKTIPTVVAALEREISLIEKKEGLAVSSGLNKKPSVMGIFTGQGAQWPAMGKLLIDSVPLAKVIAESLDESLKTLPEEYRPKWTLQEQLSLEGTESNVANATFSQPLCCAVQIILVQLLKAAGLEFKAVVGHSSGEIACAYAANFVTASQAIRIAYLRGLTSKLAASPNGTEGAMMAVGTSMEDAEALCALEMFEGRISVAASNGPESCTVSGDKDAIEEAREILEDESKFARVLKVDKAYHSHHMQPCAAPYVDVLKQCGCDIPEADGPPTSTWISSVYDGRVMTPKDCKAEYWKDNLVSPVLFSQAVEQTMIKHAPLDLGIEVGCHPALKTPCLDTIENCYSSSIPYTGCMERGKDNVDSFTSCLRYVWEHFGSASINLSSLYDKLSLDANIIDLSKMIPTYTWDHSRSYRKESRVTQSFLHGSTAPHLLLGKLSAQSTATNAQWHSFLRVRDFDWLDGHALQGQTVFPGAGYVVMGFEAAMHASGNREIELLECLRLSIDKAVTFEDEDSLVELNLTLNAKASGLTHATYEFTIDSCLARENGLTSSASGEIVVTYGTASNDALPKAQDEPPHMSKIGIDRFYRVLEEIGYGYTKQFRGLTSMKRADSKAMGDVNFPQLEDGSHRLVLHPATLDVAFQTFIGAYSAPGDRRLRSLLVPTQIDRIALNPNLARKAPAVVGFNSTSLDAVKNSIGGNIEIFEPTSRSTILQVEGLSFKPFSPPTAADDRKMYSKWEWGPLNPDKVLDDPQYWSTKEEEKEVVVMERVTYFYIRSFLAGLTVEDRDEAAFHYQKQIEWCEHIVAESKSGRLPCYVSAWEFDTEAEIHSLIEQYAYHPHIRLLQRVGENILEIVRDGGNPFDMMDHDGLLTEFYGSPKSYGNAYKYFQKLIHQISHRHQNMNILEIGGGTGGATRYVLKNGTPPSFNSYTFTDISNAFFEKAAEEFAEHQDLMDFRPLDIRRDPKDQEFTPNFYDLIIASNVLHATPSLDETMANVRALLKPGGQLVIIEVTHREHSRIGFIFGLFADWWAGVDEGRVLEPFVSYDKWDEVMKRTGFSGIESRTLDRDSHVSPNSVFSTIAINESMLKLTQPLVEPPSEPLAPLVIIGGESSGTSTMIEQLKTHLPERQVDVLEKLTDLIDFQCSPKSTFLVLSELDEEFFAGLNEVKFEAAQTIFYYAKHVMWITESAWRNNPRQGQIIGLLRTLRLEHADVQIQVVDYDVAASIDPKQLVEHLLRLEYSFNWEEQGVLWTPEPELYFTGSRAAVQRLRPDDVRNDRLNATRRPILGEFDPTEKALRVEKDGRHAYVEVVNEFSPPCVSTTAKAKIWAQYTTANAFRVGDLGYFHIVQGTLAQSGRSVLALSETNVSSVEVSSDYIYTLDAQLDADVCILQSIAADILAQSLLSKAIPGTSMLIFEPPKFCIEAIVRLAETLGAKITLASANPPSGAQPKHWIRLHEKETQHGLKSKLPTGLSAFYSLTDNDNSTSLGNRLASVLPPSCSRHNIHHLIQEIGAVLSHDHSNRAVSILEQAKRTASEAGTVQDSAVVQASQITSAVISAATVIQWKAEDMVPARITSVGDGKLFSDDKTYLLVGLAGDLGRSICRFMIMHGAKHVVLSSRHPTTDQRWIDDMINIGGDVMILPMNVAQADSLDAGLAKIRESKPPIAGVAFGPLILQDVMFKNMDLDMMEMVLEPKVNGARLLDERLSDPANPLDFFVMFSSFVMVSGNPGQAAYSAANAYTMALAQSRRSRGLAGSTIDIGAVYGVGFVARAGREEEYDVVRFMFDAVNEWELQALFAEAVVSDRANGPDAVEIITGMPVFDPAHKDQIPYYDDPRLAYFKLPDGKGRGGDATSSVGSVKDQLLKAVTIEEVRQIITDGVSGKIRVALQVAADDPISITTPLIDEGVDSLSAVTIGAWFSKNLDIDIPLLKILGGASVTDLVEEVIERLSPAAIPLTHWDAISQEGPAITEDSSSNGLNSGSASDTALDTPLTSSSLAPSPDKGGPGIERQTSLSLIQEYSWSEMQLPLDSAIFNSVVGMYMQGPIEMSRLESAVNTTLQRHDVFRTCFTEQDGKPVQLVQRSPRVRFEAIQVSDKAAAEKGFDDLRVHKFNVAEGDTVKIVNYYWTPTDHLFILAYHRLVGDGWTTERLFVEVGSLYQGMQLPPAPSYADYSARQLADKEAGRLSNDLAYWTSQYSYLPSPLPVMNLPGAYVRARPSWTFYEASARLNPMVAVRIRDRARKHKTTPLNFYLTAYHVMLARLTQARDLTIGIADANRATATEQATMGYFANYLPLRLPYESTETFGATLVAVKESMRNALLHSAVPLGSILTTLGIPPADEDALYAPLIQALFDYKQGQAESGTLGGAKMVDANVKRAGQPHDIVLEMSDDPSKDPLITVKLQKGLYGEQDAEVVMDAYLSVLTFFSRNPALRVDDGKLDQGAKARA
ncbi:putative polyketide synthase [Cucurbitaria berberidis CBS 394.84]|uniref:Polyketide synthase n=1 Tax=Cucurbitaria berberidis CBS 394.84 TaxID=1168544 RepID=A0A9P4LB97_9PLEO|nr:putative polyketide synthase [Cucurbitaria berberidis CBS 394.84]KAF1848288.1 putative polyketide synthase [Cucurbitaria berberidis CBS 394.84]